MAFYVGQRVVCVDAEGSDHLELNRVYTIKRVFDMASWWRGQRTNGGLLLHEALPNCGDFAFSPHRFRPLTDRKSEVSFTMGADPESEKWDNRKVKVRS